MIKKTLYIGNPAYLKKENLQLTMDFPSNEVRPSRSVPIEDIGIVILNHPRITLTQAPLQSLLDNNTAVLTCNERHIPVGLFMPMTVNHVAGDLTGFKNLSGLGVLNQIKKEWAP